MSAWTGSIRWRLTLGAAAAITIALIISGLALTVMFEKQLTRLTSQDLAARSTALIAAYDPNVPPLPPGDAIGGDLRYLQPYSGFYWQIELGGRTYRSQSLWDAALPLGDPPAVGETATFPGNGPDGQQLLIRDRMVEVGPRHEPLRVTVAVTRAMQQEAGDLFRRDLVPFLTVLGVFLIAASVLQVAIGLRPFRKVHRMIEEMGTGHRRRLGADMPGEVAPLASAIDDLLDDREHRIERARHRAADLAHTLKTPLQALMGETGRLRNRGDATTADAIDTIVGTIRDRVDHELGTRRIGADGTADLKDAVDKIVAVLRRTPRGGSIAILVDVPAGQLLQIDPNDLMEAVGSVAENALQHARSMIRFSTRRTERHITLMIDDDGEGVDPEKLPDVLLRGVRADQVASGSGLGLSLAEEILLSAGGKLTLENRQDGFRVAMEFGLMRK